MKKEGEIKLNIGSGNDYREGFVNIDGSKFKKTDVVLDLSGEVLLQTYAPESISYILAHDIVEHFFHWEAAALLRAFYVLLRFGGVVQIRVPDFEEIIRQPISCANKIMLLFGGQDTLGSDKDSRQAYPQYYCHKYAYTIGLLSQELVQIGFFILEAKKEGTNVVIVAEKVK